MLRKNNIQDILFIDDGSYSGLQMYLNIDDLPIDISKYGAHLIIHLFQKLHYKINSLSLFKNIFCYSVKMKTLKISSILFLKHIEFYKLYLVLYYQALYLLHLRKVIILFRRFKKINFLL